MRQADRREQIRAALQITRGAIAPAARLLGLSRKTIERYVAREPGLRDGFDELEWKDADEAWLEHQGLVQAGDLDRARWQLDNANYVARSVLQRKA